MIDAKTIDVAAKDLDKFHEALEKALMRFHGLMMEEINKLIREYWQITYQGDDIDFIEIRAEHEQRANSRYNYRVVLVRNGIELNMRGRCSAGQKVLASLVIRLALVSCMVLSDPI